MGPVQPRVVRSRSLALGVLVLVVAAEACLEIDPRDVEVLDENESVGGASGKGGTGGGSAGKSGNGGTTPGGGGNTPGTGGTAGSGVVENTGGSAAGAPPSTGGAGGAHGGAGGGSGGTDAMAGAGGTLGGSTSAGGASGNANAGGSGNPVTCEGPSSELAVDGTHWMSGECNDYQIEGSWYCFTDQIGEDDCDDSTSEPRYDEVQVGYCLSGTTVLDPEFKAWGGSLSFELHNDGAVKSSYDAAAHGVLGFELTVHGTTGGNLLRVAFTPTITGVDPAPFLEFPPLEDETRTLTALIEDAIVPPEWDVPSAGDVVDPTAIVDVQLQVVGAQREAPYEICITQVVPIASASK